MSPVDWLSLLKHPLFFHHRDRGAHLNQCRQLDLHLRKHSFSNLFNIKTAPEPLQEWYDDILSLMAPLISLTGQHALDLLIKTLLQVSETLCAPDDLWKGADGIAAHAFLQEILPFGQDYPAVSLGSFSRLLTQLLNQKIVYSPQGIGSPIRILGALEARQYSADITILAGLNEGTWPKGIESDPWLNNQMRLALGLPDPQRRIGLSAHDFCIGFSNAFANAQSKDGHDHLYLTRSLKDKGTSTLPSRWWQRLEVTLEAMGLSLPLNEDIPMLAKQLDRSLYPVQATAPAPCPPQERRPTAYSVTDIEQLMRDPYTFYAKRILRLKKIDALDRAFEARDFGQLVHKSLDNFQKHSTAQKDLALLMQEGRAVFSPFMGDSLVQRFWWPRFERIAHWLWSKWQNRQEGNLFTELPGNLFLRVGETQIELKTVIDRVEVDRGVDRNSEEPSVHIIDYKTGYLPTQKDVAHGFSPQLPLEALIFLNGGCGINPGETDAIRFKEAQLASLQYWWLKGGSEGGEIRPTSPKDLEELLATTKSGVINLLRYITQENTPYLCCPWDESMAGNRDYHHLARLKEWQG
jgi:ATP-dependent helicase/nuclease subunit B